MAIASIGGLVERSTDAVQLNERGRVYGVERKTIEEKVTIGQAELLRSYSLLIHEDATAEISIQLRAWSFKLEIKFENVDGKEPKLLLTPKRDEDNAATITFLNWNSKIGVSMKTPLEMIYLSDGSKILLQASNQALGQVNRLELQLLLQEKA